MEMEGDMIEIICDSDDDNKSKDNSKKKAVIRIPKNIKQIGDVSSDEKIYIEDYAFSYINSIAYGFAGVEQSGVLLGEYQKSSSEKCLFIKGVVKAKNIGQSKGGLAFNENIWSGIYSDIEKYFPNLEVIGWFAAVPGVTQERLEYLKKIHLDNFAGGMKTLYLVDTYEKTENFYLYESGKLKKQSGYVCYYERNYEMQEYMMEKRGRRSVESRENDKVMQSIRDIINNKEQYKHKKKSINVGYVAGSILAVIVLVMGINLMNSYEKMKKFDNSLTNIANQISDINKDDTENAKDAASSEIVPVNKLAGDVYPTTQEDSSNANQDQNQTQNSEIDSQSNNQTDNTDNNQITVENNTQQANSQNNSNIQDKSDDSQSTVSQDVSSDDNSKAQNVNTEPSYATYIVKKGDTIMSICKNYYGTIKKYDEVAALNNIDDVNKLYIGQEIKLP